MNSFDKLSISPIDTSHLDAFYLLVKSNQKVLEPYLPLTSKSGATLASANVYLEKLIYKRSQKEWYTLAVTLEEALIGIVYVKSINWAIPKCELGYFIDKNHQGKGYMSDTVRQTINYCFNDLGMHKIFLRIGKKNIGSKRVAIKNGFQLEGLIRDDHRGADGKLIDVEYYGLINSK